MVLIFHLSKDVDLLPVNEIFIVIKLHLLRLNTQLNMMHISLSKNSNPKSSSSRRHISHSPFRLRLDIHNGSIVQCIRVPSVIGNLLILLYEIARAAAAGHEIVVAVVTSETVLSSDLCALLALQPACEAAEDLVFDALVRS